ncbi:MAG: PorP/SprF family type IX secretion system membrane protein [Saprospiraceae bacterium]
MGLRHIAIVLTILLYIQNGFGQDVHFSYYQFTPLDVNPANAGAFYGSYRVSGIYSDKYASITGRPYRNFNINLDAPIIRGIRKQDWIGIGVAALQIPNANTSGFHAGVDNKNPISGTTQSLSGLKIGLAYHLSLDKKQTSILTLGAQYSIGSRNYSQLGNLSTRALLEGLKDNDWNKFNLSVDQNSTGTFSISKAIKDLNFGILYNKRQKKSDLRLGFAIKNVNTSSNSLFENNPNDGYERSIGIHVHGAYDMALNEKINITPGFFYYSYGKANALNINTQAMYNVNPEKELKIGAGLGLRNLRSIMTMIGAEYKGIKMGFDFDIDITSLAPESNGVGGYEICVGYIGKIYKRPKVKEVILCPRL